MYQIPFLTGDPWSKSYVSSLSRKQQQQQQQNRVVKWLTKWCYATYDATQPIRTQKSRAVIARIRYMRSKRRACFFVFRESDRLPTTVAGKGNLGQTKGKDILGYGRRPIDRQRLGRKLKSVSTRKPGRRWYSSSHRFCSNLAQMFGLVSKRLWQKLRLKYFIPFKLGGPAPKMAFCH